MTPVRRAVTTTTAAPADVVWRLVTDITRVGEWSPETVAAQWVSGEPATVGARFRGRNQRGRAGWSTTCEVVESDPGRSFAFAVGKARRPSAVWRYDIDDADRGCRVTESFELPRPLGFWSRLSTRVFLGVDDREADLVRGMERTLAQLAQAAEREAREPH